MLPSLRAAAATCLAHSIIVDITDVLDDAYACAMTPELRFYSGYIEMQIYPTMQRFAKLLYRASSAKLKVSRHFSVTDSHNSHGIYIILFGSLVTIFNIISVSVPIRT